jgi:hypothetical protein
MSVQDFIRTAAPPPDWLTKAWAGAKRRGLETLTLDEINAEIDAYRNEKEAKDHEAGGCRYERPGLRLVFLEWQRGVSPARRLPRLFAPVLIRRYPC